MTALRFVTLSGVPVHVSELKWPFHPSSSGSDWFILHGRVDLLESAEHLHAEVAVGLTQTIRESMGNPGREQAEGMVVNAIRKTIDNGQVAFLKSGKLQPVHLTTRFYNFRSKEIQFPAQPEADVRELVKRTVFWLGKDKPVQLAHPYDCQYVNLSRQNLLQMAQELAADGLITLEGDHASATGKLLAEETAIRTAMLKGVEAGIAATRVSA